MIDSIIAGFFNWFLTAMVIPVMYYLYDYYNLKKQNKELIEKIDILKKAKTREEINAAIDNID
jgi:hypothetical protein